MSATTHAFDHKAFAERLRISRLALDITEEEAAAAAGRSVKTWRQYEETGRGHLTDALLMFVRKYDVNLKYLLSGDGPMPRHRPRPRLVACGSGGGSSANRPKVQLRLVQA